METVSTLVKLRAQETDTWNYTTYVFELIEKDEIKEIGTKYVICVRWPNWDHRELENGEIGYVQLNLIEAGSDKWFDGKNMVPFKHNNIQFVKFITKQDDQTKIFKI